MIQTFEKDDFKLTIYGTSETPYFKAREVALLLGYKYPANAIQDNVDAEDKINFEEFLKKPCGLQTHTLKVDKKTIFINESGLYSLILSSKLPKAKDFKKWVTSEVLPSIRKTGEYQFDKNVKDNLTMNI